MQSPALSYLPHRPHLVMKFFPQAIVSLLVVCAVQAAALPNPNVDKRGGESPKRKILPTVPDASYAVRHYPEEPKRYLRSRPQA